MDDEDLAEAEEARRLQTSESFAGLGSTANDITLKEGAMDILKAGGETIGIKLLRRMGWRDGQGIGARVRRKARHDDTDDHGSSEKTYDFAPDNSAMVSLVRKDDHKGLGFEGESKLTEPTTDIERLNPAAGPVRSSSGADVGLSLIPANVRKSNKKGAARGGFGVGILNDNGSDDEDPYQMGPQIAYNRIIGGDKKKKNHSIGEKTTVSSANPLLRSKPIFISKKANNLNVSAGSRRCQDGRLPLDGFMFPQDTATLGSGDGRYVMYAPPQIPKDWKSSKQPNLPQDTKRYLSQAEAAKSQNLDPKARASLLGEALLPGKSVFDFLSPSARDRIASASGKNNLPAARAEPAPKGFALTEKEKQKELWSLVPTLDKNVAIQALGRGVGGWMPYAEDEAKRTRYRAFLELQAGLRAALAERPAAMAKDEWVTELNEFAHAAQIFKPMTGMMATRFTSSKASPKLASDTPETSDEQHLLSKPSERPEDAAEAAAKVGMYGPMTRSVQQYFPSRLLCKRFNVKPPAHVQLDQRRPPDDPSGVGVDDRKSFQSAGYQTHSAALPSTKLELVSKEALKDIMEESGARQQAPTETSIDAEAALDGKAGNIVVDAERNEALESARPGDAVFKAIFGSDDEDEDD